MFFSMGHGKRVVAASASGAGIEGAAPETATGGTGSRADPAVQSFGYLFSGAPEVSEHGDISERLEILAAAMAEPVPETDALTGMLPPVFTYLGQFIDHDLTANTDRDGDASSIGREPLLRQPRGLVEANVMNGRKGSLGLDSLYGDVPDETETSRALQAAMRDGPFLRIGASTPFGRRPPLPADGFDDLPRIGPMISEGHLDPSLLPASHRPAGPDDPKARLAFIGDGRNDENLIVAQLHLAFLRFHRRVAETLIRSGRAPADPDTLFGMVRRQVTWTYQWIVLNEYLPSVCRPQAVTAAMRDEAPLYGAFLERIRQVGIGDVLPLPFEFSAACFRFGHTMVRNRYDINFNFGRPSLDMDGPTRATLRDLFAFTGRASPDGISPPFGGAGTQSLPHNWIVEWNRLVDPRPLFPDRTARAVDDRLAAGLFDLPKEDAGIMRNLALRNLRRGYNMNLPSGQSALQALRRSGVPLGPTLTRSRLRAGQSGRALRAAGLEDEAPLWFYILKEAAELERGTRLGSVGSAVVADTITGLVVNDPDSYWHQPGSGSDGRWHPVDGVQPTGRPVTRIARLLEAAGVLDPAAA